VGLYQSLRGGFHRRFFHKAARAFLLGEEGFHITPEIRVSAARFAEKRGAPRLRQLDGACIEILNVFES
jgi:hypothetical protein